jgi:hypothetical protein
MLELEQAAKRPRGRPRIVEPVYEAPLLMSRQEAARILGGLHLATIDRFCRAGKLERVHVGRRTMLTVTSVRALAGRRE